MDFFLAILLKQSEMAIELLKSEQAEKILSPKQLSVWEYPQSVMEVAPGEIAEKTKVARPTVNQAFQTASTGTEIVLQDIIKGGKTNTNLLTGCDTPTGLIIGTNANYKVELRDNDGDKIDCNTTTSLPDVRSIKSVGTIGGNQRAIEVAVAAGCENGLRIVDQNNTSTFNGTNAQHVFDHLTDYNSSIVGFLCREDNTGRRYHYLDAITVWGGDGDPDAIQFVGFNANIQCNAGGSGECSGCIGGWVIYESCTCSGSC